MKFLLSLFAFLFLLFLSGCAYNNAGIRHYERVTSTDAKGNKTTKMMLADAISADLPGLSTLDVGRIKLTFNPDSYEVTEPVYDAKGVYLQTVTMKKLAGVYVSPVLAAQGNANRSFIDGLGAFFTGIASTIGGLFVTGGALSLVHP